MGEVSLWQASFNAGELTPLMEGREDVAKYPNGCRRLRNYHPLIQGPARRRTGTRAVTTTKGNGDAWLVPFIRQRRLAYMLEFGNNYIRFYRNRGQLESSPGVPYEIVSPWTYAQLTDVDGTFLPRTVQSNDILYICQGTGIKQLNRFGDLNWTITDFDPIGGPFEGENTTTANVYSSGQTGTVNLTSNGAIFQTNRVGSLIRLQPQDLRNVAPWEPHKFTPINTLKRSDGKTYRATVGTVGAVGPYTGTVAPIHEQGTEVDGAGFAIDPDDSTTPATVTIGLPWEFQDPGYGIVKITSVNMTGGDDAFVKLLLHMDGADASTTFTDVKGHAFTANGNAQIDTAAFKFGGASGLFDGTGDYASTPDSADFALGSGDFTIDTWFNCVAPGGSDCELAGQIDSGSTAPTCSFLLDRVSTGQMRCLVGVGAAFVSVASTSLFTNLLNPGWHHLAVSRFGNVINLFIDGILEGTTALVGSVNNSANQLAIGRRGEAVAFSWNGWIDEFRLSVGIARWTANFTPATNSYNVAGTEAVGIVQRWRTGSNAQLPAEVVGAAKATMRWSWGLFSDANGWPRAPSFFRERFVLATTQRVAFSTSGDFGDFSQETAGQLLADNAFVVDIASDRDEDLLWIKPNKRALLVGTTGGEHAITEQNVNQAFGPLNRKIEPQTGYGSNGVSPLRVGDNVAFAEASGLRLRLIEPAEGGDFAANSQNDLAEHILKSTVIQTDYAVQPDSFVWSLRADGRLACETNSKPQEVFGWSLHNIGGWRDASRTQTAKVRSIGVMPSPDGTVDDLWLIGERRINGSVVRFVEFMTEATSAPDQWENEDPDAYERRLADYQADGFFVDGGITYDVPLTITGATLVAGKIRLASAAHGLSNGQSIRVDEILGTWKINARCFTVTGATAGTVDLLESTAAMFNTYVSGGVMRLLVMSISGLGAWEGETLQVLTDGAVHPDRTVSGGAVSLQVGAGRVHLGFGFKSLIETERPSGGNEKGSAQGQLGAINHITVRLHQSLGGRVGPSEAMLDEILFRSASDNMDLPPPLFSGDKSQGWPDGFSTDRTVVFVQDQPLPSTVLGFGQDMEVNAT